MATTKWQWARTNAGQPGMGGDIAKLFKHETQKAPGVFGVDPPATSATLLAREVIQNSWDAARELQSDMPTAPQFRIDFQFTELSGSAKQGLASALDLAGLSDRVAALNRAKIGLAASDCLTALSDDEPLRVLRISERAASGMHGPWDQNKSHMFMALLSIGFTEKLSGAGGSYGYGKAGLINGSRIRSVVAYSCFQERADDPAVTRRLLGVTYWGPHDYEGNNYPGIGSFSSGTPANITPFENEAADELANALGMDLRRADDPERLGTSFLLIDPSVQPEDLVKAIERSWWPALEEGDFTASVIAYDGSSLTPRPKLDPVLHTFIDAWEIAMGRSTKGEDDWYAKLTGPATPLVPDGNVYPNVGTIGVVSDLAGWSYAEQTAGPDDEEVSHRSLVALTRSPRMVVEYLETGQSQPFLRGVFIADPTIDDLLRQTEPKAHDSWRTKPEENEVDPEAAGIADHVTRRIKQTINNHRNRLKPPVPPPEDVNLPFFNQIMQRVMSGMGGGVRQPVPETRPISIRLDHGPRVAGDDGLIEMAGSANFGLTEHHEGDSVLADLKIVFRYIEDERVGEHAQLTVTPPEGFTEVETGVYRGRLERGADVVFGFVSEPYDPSWSGRLFVSGDPILSPAEATE